MQSQSQLKAIYKDNADTIVGNCDTTLFLGGKEKTTLKEISEILGKETIDSFNTSETRGRELSHGLNYQKLGKQLMTEDEIAVMDGGKCILQLRGVRPFFSDKFDIAELQKTVRLLTDEVRNMDELLALLRKKQFAPSSEQTKPTEEQLGLFNEAEQENKPEPKEPIKKDARGYHTDGYAGYNKIPHVTRCGCWAHLRRKFVEAMPPESNASIPAQIGRNLCDQLFAAEKEIQRLPPEQRQEKRLAVEQPMLRAFWCWLDELSTQPLAGSLKKAVEYAQGQRSYMENYLKDPRYEISNNRAENKIHPFTVGRKNWLFSDTPAGAKASAVIYSIVETAKANNLAPRDYIQFLFENLPDMEIQTHPERLDQMLPWGKLIQENFA